MYAKFTVSRIFRQFAGPLNFLGVNLRCRKNLAVNLQKSNTNISHLGLPFDLGDQREDLGDRREDLGDRREDFGD